ncbi:MAG: hypothetical protein JKX92_09645 [Porticoccaceae bacterium]|nr:hypothetical protein [Porticoccaceae bacterium]
MFHPSEPEGFIFSKGIRPYARGVDPLLANPAMANLDTFAFPATILLKIAGNLLRGEIPLVQKNYGAALTHYEISVALQDSLPYTEPPY